jgi:hypothetical protein
MTAVGTAWMHSALEILAINCAILSLFAVTGCSAAQLVVNLSPQTASSAKNRFHLNKSQTYINIIFNQRTVTRSRATEMTYLHNIKKQTRSYRIRNWDIRQDLTIETQ